MVPPGVEEIPVSRRALSTFAQGRPSLGLLVGWSAPSFSSIDSNSLLPTISCFSDALRASFTCSSLSEVSAVIFGNGSSAFAEHARRHRATRQSCQSYACERPHRLVMKEVSSSASVGFRMNKLKNQFAASSPLGFGGRVELHDGDVVVGAFERHGDRVAVADERGAWRDDVD